MRYSENERKVFKRKCKSKAQFQKRKENIIIAVRKDISLKNADYPRLIMRKPIILKRSEDGRLKKSFS
jgi:hypothetical protein